MKPARWNVREITNFIFVAWKRYRKIGKFTRIRTRNMTSQLKVRKGYIYLVPHKHFNFPVAISVLRKAFWKVVAFDHAFESVQRIVANLNVSESN